MSRMSADERVGAHDDSSLISSMQVRKPARPAGWEETTMENCYETPFPQAQSTAGPNAASVRSS
jgi:hypothetical protein